MASVVSIDTDLCENEQVCEAVCPEPVFRIEDGVVRIVDAGSCTICFKCAESCPNGAIELDY
ncbi:MAG: 4Fe-4S dicluster domain-containing protein [Acidobacteriota bacterium]|nr:4Fe-4S dicluster domain-containing protein [Acidobacteriota bacterium]MDQ7087357.1 4Fe-4S dicluster domain-containing protein [Acidobacteriota bacterium]